MSDAQPSIPQNLDYWDGMAPKWDDEIFNSLESDRTGVILTELERASRDGSTVADFGCGIGGYLPTLDKLFDEVHGFEQSEACAEVARERVQELDHVTVHVADAAPRSSRGQFDVVLCVNAAIHPEKKVWHRVLRSARSLLKPQGRLIGVVPSLESAELIAKAEGNVEEAIQDGGIVSIDGVPTKHFTRQELSEELAGLGLKVYRIKRVEYSWKSQDVVPPAALRGKKPWDWIVVARDAA